MQFAMDIMQFATQLPATLTAFLVNLSKEADCDWGLLLTLLAVMLLGVDLWDNEKIWRPAPGVHYL